MNRFMLGVALLVVAMLGEARFPRIAEAQQAKLPRIGIAVLAKGHQQWVKPFERALAERGWVAGKNVVLEYRLAPDNASGLVQSVGQLVQLKVDMIFASGAPILRAAQRATSTIPIVVVDYTTDPIAAGYAQSYSRPGKNVTGVFLDEGTFAGKWVEILKSLVPHLSRVAVLWDPSPGERHLNAVKQAAKSFGMSVQVLQVRTPADIEKTFANLHGQPQAMIILPSPLMYSNSERLAELTLKHRLPATSMAPSFAHAGGSVTYGPDLDETLGRCAAAAARILGGAKPGDIPIERPMKFEFLFNPKTLKALGLRAPDTLSFGAKPVN